MADPRRAQVTAGSSTTPGGTVPVAASQPKAAMRALNTFAMPRPMPAATAHSRASGHENRVLVGSNGEGAAASLRTTSYRALMSFRASSPPSRPMPVETTFHIRSRVTLRIYLVVILAVRVALDLGCTRSRDTQDHPSLVSQAALRF